MPNAFLCATDGSEHSKIAVSYASHLAKSEGRKLIFLSVNIALGGARGPLTYQRDDAQVKDILNEAESVAKEAGLSACDKVTVKSRDAAWAIVQYAEEQNVGHIIVGTGDRSIASRLMLGSVAREVASKAHCSVTVAR